jgi:hypothetical protein
VHPGFLRPFSQGEGPITNRRGTQGSAFSQESDRVSKSPREEFFVDCMLGL